MSETEKISWFSVCIFQINPLTRLYKISHPVNVNHDKNEKMRMYLDFMQFEGKISGFDAEFDRHIIKIAVDDPANWQLYTDELHCVIIPGVSEANDEVYIYDHDGNEPRETGRVYGDLRGELYYAADKVAA